MSELKVYRDPREGPCWSEFYDKSEVDAVLAEMYSQEEYDKQKYKRCLANAEICCEKKENCYNRALRKYSKDEADYLIRKSDFWQDWEFRWLKLAEKFKEVK